MNRRQWIMKIIFSASLVVVLLSTCWSLAYFVTIWSYQRLDWQPHGLFRQLINSLLGFFFFGGFISIMSPFIRKKRMVFFQEMIDALKRISSGDFQVYLNVKARGSHAHFGELVESINDMAVNLKSYGGLAPGIHIRRFP